MTNDNRPRQIRWSVLVAAAVPVAIALLLVAILGRLERVNVVDGPARTAVVPERETVIPPGRVDLEPAGAAGPTVADAPPEPEAQCVDPIPVAGAPDPAKRIVVLPARIDDDDPAAAVLVDSIRQAMLAALSEQDDFEVIDMSEADLAAYVPANAGGFDRDRLVYLMVSRRYNARNVVQITEESNPQSPTRFVGVTTTRGQGGGGTGTSVMKDGDPQPGSDPRSLGEVFAQSVVGKASQKKSRRAPAIDAPCTLRDPTRPDSERLSALSDLGDSVLDSETIAGAVQLGTQSASAPTRKIVWRTLRTHAYDPALAQPLSYTLLSDLDADVREESALALAEYADDRSIRPALEYARDNDSSAEVRLAAGMALMDQSEQQAFKRQMLLNGSLTPAERLAPTMLSYSPIWHGLAEVFGAAQDEEVHAYAEILAATANPELKKQALRFLQDSMVHARRLDGSSILDDGIVQALIDSVAVEDEGVRLTTLNILKREVHRPRVRDVLQKALTDYPDLTARVGITAAFLRNSQSPNSSL